MTQQVKELEKLPAPVMETAMAYFDTERDNILIAKGTHFFCNACSVAAPIEEQSPDPRYCQECCRVLLKEMKGLNPDRHSKWMPKMPKRGRGHKPQPLPDALVSMDIIEEKVVKVSNPLTQLCPPLKANTGLADNKRGPKSYELPGELIHQLAGKGFSPQAIAAKLADEHQIFVSYKTIKRRLQGVLV